MSETNPAPEGLSPVQEAQLREKVAAFQRDLDNRVLRKTDPLFEERRAEITRLAGNGEEARQAAAPDPLAPVQSPDDYRVISGDLPPGVDVADPGLKQGRAFGVEFEVPQNEFRGVMLDASHLARVEQRGGDPVAEGWKQHIALFGSKQAAEAAVAKAQTVLAKRPDLVAWLDATGLANSARVTAILARRAK